MRVTDVAQDWRDFWEACEGFRRELDLAELAIDPDAVFDGVRDPSPGRELEIEDWRD
jgi:hypothetical protein